MVQEILRKNLMEAAVFFGKDRFARRLAISLGYSQKQQDMVAVRALEIAASRQEIIYGNIAGAQEKFAEALKLREKYDPGKVN